MFVHIFLVRHKKETLSATYNKHTKIHEELC